MTGLRSIWRYQIKGVIRIHKSKKNRQHNGHKKKDKQRSTKHTYKTKDRVTRTPLKTRDELRCSRKVGSSCSTSGTRPGNLITNPVISHEWSQTIFNSTYPLWKRPFRRIRLTNIIYLQNIILFWQFHNIDILQNEKTTTIYLYYELWIWYLLFLRLSHIINE